MSKIKIDYDNINMLPYTTNDYDTVPLGYICMSTSIIPNYQVCNGGEAKGDLKSIMNNVPNMLGVYPKINKTNDYTHNPSNNMNHPHPVDIKNCSNGDRRLYSFDQRNVYTRNDSQNRYEAVYRNYSCVENHTHTGYSDYTGDEEWLQDSFLLIPQIKYKKEN